MKAEYLFKVHVEAVVMSIPKGRVMTYGQIATICGSPRAARIVGGIAHYGNPELPWHRVVNRYGKTADGYPGGSEQQAELLKIEGIKFDGVCINNLKGYIWWPNEK